MTNDTLFNGDSTVAPLSNDSSTGLAVGLTLFFLLLVAIAVVLAYKYRPEIMTKLQFGQKRQQKNLEADGAEVPPPLSERYCSRERQQSVEQQPIYENVTVQTSSYKEGSANAASQRRLPEEHHEDVYLQCDSEPDAIYSNDPACDLSSLPGRHEEEEDVYIVPDS